MPELPEVETVRIALGRALEGRRLVRVEILDARLVAPEDPRALAGELAGETVAGVERRGKYLLIRFESGRVLLSHLRMTGSFRGPANRRSEADTHVRAVVGLDDGQELIYRDVRRFGTWRLLEAGETEPYLEIRLGVEPLQSGFTAVWLARRLSGRRAPIKAALLDQRTAAGLGNIYADEALWRAKVHPERLAGGLSTGEIRRLRRAVRDSLRLGIARQGATLRDYARPSGENGRMQHEFKVYGRAGEPCDRCGTPITKTRVGGRGTWFCPSCQPSEPAS